MGMNPLESTASTITEMASSTTITTNARNDAQTDHWMKHHLVCLMMKRCSQTQDSRFWGTVPRENIIGRALVVYWSLDEADLNDPSSEWGTVPESWFKKATF